MLRVKETRLFPFENLGTEVMADPVVHRIAQNRGHGKKDEHQPNIKTSNCSERARGEQQGISWQERRKDQPRLTENHQEEYCVDLRPELDDQLADVVPQMENDVKQLSQDHHI